MNQPRRRAKRLMAAGITATLAVAALLGGQTLAQADSVWVQSYQRASADESCAAQLGETPWQAGWGPDSSWSPSWEKWANDGRGGWTCTRSIVWARDVASSSVTYALGDIGPGGGLVFLIDGGLTYEMAPATWPGENNVVPWCNLSSDLPTGTALGTGLDNTYVMNANCMIDAGQAASVYDGGGYTDWFLPSKTELNALCNYSRNPSAPALPSVACSGAQDSAFAAGSYGFLSGAYWSSSQRSAPTGWAQNMISGVQSSYNKASAFRVRAIRVF